MLRCIRELGCGVGFGEALAVGGFLTGGAHAYLVMGGVMWVVVVGISWPIGVVCCPIGCVTLCLVDDGAGAFDAELVPIPLVSSLSVGLYGNIRRMSFSLLAFSIL
jgi:hypothetical protein